jgi:antibiotic biosynthesis monooxygenase (ABM) superfamily enzyme
MIKRIWHGWVPAEVAESYERLLSDEVLAAIAARKIPGHRDTQVWRQARKEEVEFVVVMTFDSRDSIREFAGDDPTVAYVPEEAKAYLSRWDERAQHYELREHRAC